LASVFERSVSRRALAVGAGILALILIAMLRIAPSAQAAGLLYWENYTDSTIAGASLEGGSIGGALNLTGVTLKDPEGMTYDPVANRLFVASSNGGPTEEGQIVFVNLDGSGAGALATPGAPVESPEGIALDPVSRIVYWANGEGAGSIGWARLDGSGGGLLNTAGATMEDPYRLALDPVAGRVYWANSKPEVQSISYANVDNSGGGDLDLTGAVPPESITGLAVDPTGNRIYWLDNKGVRVSFAALSGGEGGYLDLYGAPFNDPYGLALDSASGTIYWANYGNEETKTGAFGYSVLAGGGGSGIDVGGGGSGSGIDVPDAPVNGPQDPVIIRSPFSTEPHPRVFRPLVRGKHARNKLRCSHGGWTADHPGGNFYQAPRSFAYRWKHNGNFIKGAKKASLKTKAFGNFVCIVTAINQAGSQRVMGIGLIKKRPNRHH
jgi:hypothetical protein